MIDQRDAFQSRRKPEPARWETRAWQFFAGLGTGVLVAVGLVSIAVDVFGKQSNTGGLVLTVGLFGLGGVAWAVWRRSPRGLAMVAIGAVLGLFPFVVLITVTVAVIQAL